MCRFPSSGCRGVVRVCRLFGLIGFLVLLAAPSFAQQRCSSDQECPPEPAPCSGPSVCADGYCVIQPLADGSPCEDGDLCTVADVCQGGACVPGRPPDCDDGNPCTADTCDPATGCAHVAQGQGEIECDDGDPCTELDRCHDGVCQGATAPPCDDGNPCTHDYCDPARGCVYDPAGGYCEADGDVCTEDICTGGECRATGGLRYCPDDGNPCTADICDPSSGCAHVPQDSIPCDDGDVCTWDDRCQGGACYPGPPVACDDGNPCTADTCDPAGGCVQGPVPDGTFCDVDSNLCTQDTCIEGGCQPGPRLTCDDGNACTTDLCDRGECRFVPDTDSPCDDGNACNEADMCVRGVCVGGPDVDTDGDGTADCYDGCPTDPLKTSPGNCGCGVQDVDRDGDGALDCEEGCPDDPLKTSPGICGCGVSDDDSDADGTADCRDACPGDPGKVSPGACGCFVDDTDSDGDATPDCNDGCPGDPAKTEPGLCGCGVTDTDADGDGTPDCHDGCPGDPSKTEPLVCGCGVAETDRDGDGTLDCIDLCDDDPDKSEPGICGCRVPDTDTDADGTADCNDGCPADPGKVVPGVCGCGIADTDVDGDGILDCRDNCPQASNPDQADADRDGIGNLCEPLDHYLSYKVRFGKGAPRFAPEDVALQDQFRQSNFVVRRPVGLLNPVEKTHEGTVAGIGNPDLHYLSYHVNGAPFRLDNVRIRSQFGELTLDLKRADRLLVPAFKALPGGTLPAGTPQGADHYLCYRVNVSGDRDDEGEDDDDDESCDPRFPSRPRVRLLDEFNLPRDFDVVRPTRLCAPAVKTHDGVRHDADVANPANHLTCYRVRPAGGEAKHQRVHGIRARDQFGDHLLDTQKEREVCVPSTKTAP